jgi:hypothetical protein
MATQNILTIVYEKCECGVDGDINILATQNDVDHVWCTICGAKLKVEKEDN